MSTTTVFISHSFKDSKIAASIKEQLKKMELGCYLAENDTHYGESLPLTIRKAIDSSFLVIVLLTKDGHTSPSVNQEIGYATNAKKPLIPLVERGISPALFLQGIKYVEFEKEKLDEAISKVTEYITTKFKSEFGEKWYAVLLIVVMVLGLVMAAYYTGKR